jgi:MinD superfamily P-loop ATPase
MKEIVVISGKGGTGKTSVTASLAVLGGESLVVADCDVDAANLHLLLTPEIQYREDFYSGKEAEINPRICTDCGNCAEVCHYGAILKPTDTGQWIIDKKRCEGCGYCSHVCPAYAITLSSAYSGEWFRSKTRTGGLMVHAELAAGADNSGKLVARVKNEARKSANEVGADYVLVDGSPGIGCPVISSLSGAAFAVLVTEPTKSALHDLRRVYEIVRKFSISAGCVINKADLNPEVENEILGFLQEENIPLLGTLPYDSVFSEAMTAGMTIVEYSRGEITGRVEEIWEHLLHEVSSRK